MTEDEARAQLRERQGAGARYDSAAAPARDLLWARRGTAYFARKINELSDGALDAPSLVAGWRRRHVIAHIGFHARALARIVEAAQKGDAEERLAEPENTNEEIEFGATLPAHALRYLFKHSEVHLNVEWRDLPENGWEAHVRSLSGVTVPIRKTPWLRARRIWLCAVDLDNNGSFRDFPPDFLAALRDDIISRWSEGGLERPGMVLAATDGPGEIVLGESGPRVSGSTADIVCWLSGRGARRLTSDTGVLPDFSPIT